MNHKLIAEELSRGLEQMLKSWSIYKSRFPMSWRVYRVARRLYRLSSDWSFTGVYRVARRLCRLCPDWSIVT
nr:uncharacterized protein CTRU02_10024 [Colletotrichum truncatum]KAF6787730.1 hypothetical protein CTRU02_10024 [Colletotrichum truncatum]